MNNDNEIMNYVFLKMFALQYKINPNALMIKYIYPSDSIKGFHSFMFVS